MATIPVFRTWVAGEVVTAAYFNANVRDAGNFFLSWPVFEGRQTVAQSIANASFIGINLDTEDIDTDNMHSTSSNTSRATVVTPGRYQVSGAVSYAANATGRRAAILYQNGSAMSAGQLAYPATAANDAEYPTRTKTVLGAINDYFEVIAFQESGGAVNTFVGAASAQPSSSVRMVGTV